jgi:hypothetical protein
VTCVFGYILPNLESLGEEEKLRYHAVYCGVCRSIRARYGQRCRLAVSYDMTFLALVLGSLYEPKERRQAKRCPVHPVQPQEIAQSEFTDYAADLSAAMAYHKCMDDWRDDHSAKARAAAAALAVPYRKAKHRVPEACRAIEDAMAAIHAIEDAAMGKTGPGREGAGPSVEQSPDAAANCFGLLLGNLFAYKDDFWATDLRRFGARLGKFVYVMDAAMDLRQDRESGSYNPFAQTDRTREDLREDLELLAASTADAFERLPLERDVHVLRSVLYSGVWQRYNAEESKVEHG